MGGDPEVVIADDLPSRLERGADRAVSVCIAITGIKLVNSSNWRNDREGFWLFSAP
jgi:hypothetical protein